jgi:hypothetical protein
MARGDIPADVRKRIAEVRNQRARRLLELIVEHGEVTTEQLTSQYGYNHPPRAKKDATDLGFPIVSRTVSSKDGSRRISAYSLDLDAAFVEGRFGRRAIPKATRAELLRRADGRCAVCGAVYADRVLQVDHRVPYEVAGESDAVDLTNFQMLCPSCNRSKSWTCERDCPNWIGRDPSLCLTCLWGSPDRYEHVATRGRRQVTVVWDDEDVAAYERLAARATARGQDVATYLRNLVDDE